jgi:hypothetical protein
LWSTELSSGGGREMYRLNFRVSVLSPEPIPEDMDFPEMVREGLVGAYALDVRQDGTMEILSRNQGGRALERAGFHPGFFDLSELLERGTYE